MVQPKMQSAACSGETLRDGLADHRDHLALVFEARAGVPRLDRLSSPVATSALLAR